MEKTITPKLSTIVKTGHLADTIALSVNVTYPDEQTRRVSFVGDPIHGGPVTMISGSMPNGVHVYNPSRFGSFGPEWIARFFGQGD